MLYRKEDKLDPMYTEKKNAFERNLTPRLTEIREYYGFIVNRLEYSQSCVII